MFKEAVEALKKSIDLNPESPSAHFQIGNAFFEMGQLPMAKKAFEKSLSINSASSIAYHKLSVVLSKMGKNVDAIAKANEAISLEPEKPGYHMNLGHIYVHLIRLDDAKKSFEEGTEA